MENQEDNLIMNKRCKICGQEKPQHEFSKAYKHRCKACVAEAAREERKRYKKLEEECMQALHPAHQFSQTTYTPNPRYVIATAAMQGLLSNPAIYSESLTIQEVEDLSQIATRCADSLMKKLEIDFRHD